MPFLLILAFLGLAYIEFKLVSTVYAFLTHQYDAVSAIFLIMLSFFLAISLGARIIRRQGQSLFSQFRDGQGSGNSKKLLGLLAGILFIIPGYLSDLLALVCLFPPTAWLLNRVSARLMQKILKNSNFTFYSNVGGFGSQAPESRTYDNDSTIIDVEAFDSPKKLN